MRKKGIKKILLSFLVVMSISVPVWGTEQGNGVKRPGITLEMATKQYEDIGETQVEELFARLDEAIHGEWEEFQEWQKDYDKLKCQLETKAGIAKLNYELHQDQSSYFEEYLTTMEVLEVLTNNYIDVMLSDEIESISEEVARVSELTIERTKLVDEYMNLQGTLTVEVEGKKVTLSELMADENISSMNFYKAYDSWLDKYNQMSGEILIKLIKIDNEAARILGYKTYAEYAYEIYKRDYTIDEVKAYIKNVKEIIPPIYNRLELSTMAATTILKQYDYQSEKQLLEDIDRGFLEKHKQLEEAYEFMNQYRLCDIEPRQYKGTGGFTIYLEDIDEAYVVINYIQPIDTALTFIHEFGHYFSYYEGGLHEGGLDLDETYSQSLELIAMSYYSEIFKDDVYAKAAQVYTINNILSAIIEGCLYEEFLQEVYQKPNITVKEMNAIYKRLVKEYGLNEDERNWCFVPHTYEMPFYYLSYSVAGVTALEVWTKVLENEEKGMATYLNLVEADTNESFMESIKSAGLNSPLEKGTLQKVADAIITYLDIEDDSITKKAA